MKRITTHNPKWREQYQAEADLLFGLIGKTCTQIHHIGSTAVPNIPAKPVVDILLEATSLKSLDEYTTSIVNINYEARGEYGISGRRYFVKKPLNELLAIHLHCYQEGSHQVTRHLAFRDYLRVNPDAAKQYTRIKLSMSDENGILVSDYQDRKKPFVDNLTLEAISYFSKRKQSRL